MVILNETLTGQRINEILDKTITAIESGKKEIFEIAENTRTECERLNMQLDEIKNETKKLIKEVDRLQIKERKSRNKLAEVSKNFEKYTEEDIRRAYQIANNFRIELIMKRKEEKDLILRRNELERRIKLSQDTLERAERLVSQVGVALEYLSGDLDKVVEKVDDLNKKQLLGIKIIKAQEEERQRVAREIHDGPAQSLANVILKTEICEKMFNIDKAKAINELKELKDIVRGSLKDVRKIIYDLRPMSLDDLGLIPTIQRYGQIFYEETGIEVKVNLLDMESELNSYIQLAVFRIIQEALNNVKKHSKATRVLILIEVTREKLNLIIKDNGVGFDVDSLNKSNEDINSGFGLMGIKERAMLLDGMLEIKSTPRKGTEIILILPTNRKDDLDE